MHKQDTTLANLSQAHVIRAYSSFTDVTIAAFKDNGLPISNSAD